jgi:hypothetical protein
LRGFFRNPKEKVPVFVRLEENKRKFVEEIIVHFPSTLN